MGWTLAFAAIALVSAPVPPPPSTTHAPPTAVAPATTHRSAPPNTAPLPPRRRPPTAAEERPPAGPLPGPRPVRLLGAARDVAGDFAPAGAVAGMVTLVLVAHGAVRRRNPELDAAPLADGDGVVRFR